jgi:glycosyltransferase involved in cell wall biosynthesis
VSETGLRIGLLSNFWYLRGGLEAVMFGDARLMTARGHAVAGFAAAHPLNDPAEYSRFFPPVTDHASVGHGLGLIAKSRAALRLFRNGEAVRAFDRFADAFRPDVVHQHGISRQLSASVLAEAHRRKIPTVLTLHDYSLRCPAGTLSRTAAHECIAVSCAGHRYDRAVRFRCVHDSTLASVLAATELLVARGMKRYERSVDLFLVPSEYVLQRMTESGLPAARMAVMPNAIETTDTPSGGSGSCVVAYGRLVREKGFDVVVEAARRLPGVTFVIAGDGPERASLELQAAGLTNLTFVGRLDPAAVERLLSSAFVVIVPSTWPEPFGVVVLEAWRAGVPVIVSRRGALPEIVEDGRTGLIVPPSDVDVTAAAIARLDGDRVFASMLGEAGAKEAAEVYSIEAHGDRLESLYRRLT